MGKIDQRQEKIDKNEAYAKKFRKPEDDRSQEKGDMKKRGGPYGSWCRTAGHPRTCECTYP